jgi:hypothetical protein
MSEPDAIKLGEFYKKLQPQMARDGHLDCIDSMMMLNHRVIERDQRIAELEKYRDILESEVIQRTDRIAELEGALKECKAKAYSLRTVESIVDRALLGGGDG